MKKHEVAIPPPNARYDALPPEDRLPPQSGRGTAVVFKTIVVRDERGQIVSVTKVAPDARYGVAVQPEPGQTVKEYAAGTLAEEPFPRSQKEAQPEPRTRRTKKK